MMQTFTYYDYSDIECFFRCNMLKLLFLSIFSIITCQKQGAFFGIFAIFRYFDLAYIQCYFI